MWVSGTKEQLCQDHVSLQQVALFRGAQTLTGIKSQLISGKPGSRSNGLV